jgi:hypothetical protein
MPLDKDEKVIKVKTALIAPNARKNQILHKIIGLRFIIMKQPLPLVFTNPNDLRDDYTVA